MKCLADRFLFGVFPLSFFMALTAAGSSAAEQGAATANSSRLWVYVGTYTQGSSKGIYLCHLDLATGKVQSVGLAGASKNPSFVAFHPSRPFLYAVGETATFGGKPTGAVSAFSIQPKTGMLTLLNRQSSGGTGPCHLSVDRIGRNVLVANYGGGSIACLPIRDDGRLDEPSCVVQHSGSSINPQRQKGPHAHSVYVDADNRMVLTADLGLDKILLYRLDATGGKLRPNRPAWATVPAGAGPRHLAFHPGGRNVYAINELDSTVTAFHYDSAGGRLQSLQDISTVPEGFQGSNTTAEVQIHPSGKFLYGSNRGHNSIAVFAVDGSTGKLRALGHQSTLGKTPRGFCIDPTGRYLLAANQDSNNMVVLRIDAETGGLRPTGQTIDVPAPVCVEIIRPID